MRIALVLALATLAVGCGDDDSGDGTLTVDELPGAYRLAACRFLVACGQFPDRSSCMSANLPTISDGFTFDLEPNLVAAVKAGRVLIDTARVSACLAQLGSSSCDGTDSRNLYKQCRHYLSGTLAGGATCFLDEECISQDCAGGVTMDACVAGTCFGDAPPSRVPAAIGEPCTFDPGCTDDAFCDYNDTFTCLPLRGAGETCISYDECAYGLACGNDGDGTRSCRTVPALGEPCPLGECRGGYCSQAGRCEQTGLEGAACSGEFLECAWAYPCDTGTGTCTRGPGVGEPCAMNSIVRCFDRGLVCDGATSTCITPKADGQPCTVDAVCQSGHCDFVADECAAPPVCF